MGKRNKGGTTAKETKDEATEKGDDDYLNKVIDSQKKEIPWFLSQKAMSLAVVIGIVGLYLNDNPIELPSFSSMTTLALDPGDPMALCTLVMANSSLPDSGWGMFPLSPITRGEPVSFGDPIIQVADITGEQAPSLSHILHNYMWTGDVTGGVHEGRVVYSVLPGVGSLANGHPTQWNMAPSMGASVNEANALRGKSAGAGAFTHYHDFAFRASNNIEEGQELMVNYGEGWLSKISHEDLGETTKRRVPDLRQEGICLDHIRPDASSLKDAGRGAFATRTLPEGTLVAPIPLIPIQSKEALKGAANKNAQLLLNYCLGHAQSSMLLVPYAPVVNLVNHGAGRKANVKMQWSTSTLHIGKQLLDMTAERLFQNPNGLLLELVAIREIAEGDEILVDYGDAWQAAWDQHVANFQPTTDEHAYARILNEETWILRTYKELVSDPYPSNLRTTCSYSYAPDETASPIQWVPVADVKKFSNLYPCIVLERHVDHTYTVIIHNQESLLSQIKIPTNHIVQGIPRDFIRIDDKLQKSDQHLRHAFRHEIHIPDSIFPQGWRDLA
jgi:hypothetical protein